jgi:hypothetical protein
MHLHYGLIRAKMGGCLLQKYLFSRQKNALAYRVGILESQGLVGNFFCKKNITVFFFSKSTVLEAANGKRFFFVRLNAPAYFSCSDKTALEDVFTQEIVLSVLCNAMM